MEKSGGVMIVQYNLLIPEYIRLRILNLILFFTWNSAVAHEDQRLLEFSLPPYQVILPPASHKTPASRSDFGRLDES